MSVIFVDPGASMDKSQLLLALLELSLRREVGAGQSSAQEVLGWGTGGRRGN